MAELLVLPTVIAYGEAALGGKYRTTSSRAAPCALTSRRMAALLSPLRLLLFPLLSVLVWAWT